MDPALARLDAYLRIPSISTDPAYRGEVRRCAEYTAELLRGAGLAGVRLVEGAGHPVVTGMSERVAGRPTLLLYGHYDVQPPEPLEEWVSPPFEPQIRGENLYARGAGDDKGLVSILIEAVRRFGGKPPVNVVALIEGEEESGGEMVETWVRSRPAELTGVDAAVICDTEMFAPEWPSICVGLRGIVYGEIHVSIGEQDLHSGVYGGAVPNAIQAAAEIVAALKGPDGVVRVPGFYDAVAEPSAAEAASRARLPFDEEAYRSGEARVWALTGEPGRTVLERTWSRPTFEVHGIRGGFTGEGSKTVIPARAVVKVSCRLVPDQDPAVVARQLSEAVAAVAPRGARAEFKLLSGARPSSVDPANRFVEEAAAAMTEVFGRETVFIRTGGSIPIVNLFAEELGIPSVMMGFGLPDDNLHAPNEKLYLPNFRRGIEAVVKYFERLG